MLKFRIARRARKPARKSSSRLAVVFAVLALLFGVGTASVATAPEAQAATTVYKDLNYPWKDAAYVDSDYDWGYTTCPESDTNCKAKVIKGYGVYDPWNYYLRNCTSYVSWKLSQLGVSSGKFVDLHDAKYWASPPAARNLTVNTTPAVGSVAVRTDNTYGHVAFVESVNNDGTITVSEYNHNEQGDGDERTDTASNMHFSKFVHFESYETTTPTASTPPPPLVNHPEGVATVTYNGTLQAFYDSRGSGTLRHAVMNSSGSWSNFENMDGNAGSIAGQLGSYGTQVGTAVTAIVFNNTLYVFYYAASSGNLRVMWTSPTQGWQVTNLDGDVGSLAWSAGNYATHTGQSISAAVFGSTLQLFYTADGGRVRHAVMNSTGVWNKFENLDGNAGSIASQVGPYTTANVSVNSIVDASGVLHVFYPTSDGKLRHMWTSPTQGWQLQSLDGDVGSVAGQLNSGSFATPAGGVNSIVDPSGVLRVFYSTTAGLRTMWTSATQTWQVTNLDGDPGSLAGQAGNYGTNIGASISSAVDASGAIQLVYPANGELRHAVMSTAGAWGHFENLDGDAGSIAGQLGSYGANVGNPASVSVLGSTIQILYRQASNGDMRTLTTTPPTSGWAVTNLDGDSGSLAGQAGNYGTDLG